jgi:hypothetical protein
MGTENIRRWLLPTLAAMIAVRVTAQTQTGFADVICRGGNSSLVHIDGPVTGKSNNWNLSSIGNNAISTGHIGLHNSKGYAQVRVNNTSQNAPGSTNTYSSSTMTTETYTVTWTDGMNTGPQGGILSGISMRSTVLIDAECDKQNQANGGPIYPQTDFGLTVKINAPGDQDQRSYHGGQYGIGTTKVSDTVSSRGLHIPVGAVAHDNGKFQRGHLERSLWGRFHQLRHRYVPKQRLDVVQSWASSAPIP